MHAEAVLSPRDGTVECFTGADMGKNNSTAGQAWETHLASRLCSRSMFQYCIVLRDKGKMTLNQALKCIKLPSTETAHVCQSREILCSSRDLLKRDWIIKVLLSSLCHYITPPSHLPHSQFFWNPISAGLGCVTYKYHRQGEILTHSELHLSTPLHFSLSNFSHRIRFHLCEAWCCGGVRGEQAEDIAEFMLAAVQLQGKLLVSALGEGRAFKLRDKFTG